MSHMGFVLWSYGATAFVIGSILVWLIADRAATLRELERLEKSGVRRRSDAAAMDDPGTP